MKKKALSLALALVMCLGLFVVPASAAGATLTEIVSADTYDQFLTDGYGNYWSSGGMSNFTEGIASCGSPYTGYGAFDTTGKVILPPGTSEAEITFHDGVAWVFKTGYWIAVDTSGSELFRLKPGDIGASSVEVFSDGMARVSNREGMSGYLDTTGKLVIPMEYKVFPGEYRGDGNFHDGMAQVYDPANAFFGYIDKTGRLAVPYQYDTGTDFANGFARVKRGETWSAVDKTGKVVDWLPEGYTFSEAFTSEIMVLKGTNGFVLVNKNGQIVSGPYDGVRCYTNFCQVYKSTSKSTSSPNNKYGYVNDAGVEIIPCQYDNLGEFRDGFTVGLMGHDMYTLSIIDDTGNVTVTRPGYSLDQLSNIGNGCFVIYDNKSSVTKRYGLIDCTGREIVPCKYKGIGDFSCGVAQVWDFSNNCGFVNTEGQEVLPCKFRDIIARSNGTYQVKGYHDDDRWSVIRGSGWTAPTQPTTLVTPPAVPTVGNFTDVNENDWFAKPVLWAVEEGITSGTSKNTFSPDKDCTVAQILTFLYQAYGAPKTSGSNPFTDVKESDWYYSAARWAYEQGIVSDSTFGGSQPCTRSMAVTYMWKAAGSPSAKAAGFSDVPSSADYAQAVAWAVEKGVTGGTSATTFSPDKVCTRGQIVTLLYAALVK